MPRYLVKLDNRYCEWSTIVDASLSPLMDKAALREYIRGKYGAEGAAGLNDLPSRMERTDRNGTSALDGTTLQGLIDSNRAGPNETTLSEAELIRLLSSNA